MSLRTSVMSSEAGGIGSAKKLNSIFGPLDDLVPLLVSRLARDLKLAEEFQSIPLERPQPSRVGLSGSSFDIG